MNKEKNTSLIWIDYPYFCNIYLRRTKKDTYYLHIDIDAATYEALKNASELIRSIFPEEKIKVYGSFRDDPTKSLKQNYSIPITHSTVSTVETGYQTLVKNLRKNHSTNDSKDREYAKFKDGISEFIIDILNT